MLDVPGMGRREGEWWSNQARATCWALTPCASATAASAERPVSLSAATGCYGKKMRPSVAQTESRPSDDRSPTL
jgi:hypothetical protein